MAGFIGILATPSPPRTTAIGSPDGQKTGLCRQRRAIGYSNLRPWTSGGFGVRLHSCQHGPPLLGNLPATVAPFDETLAEDFEFRHACRQFCGAFRPLASAGDKDGHVALEVRQACKAVGITHQYFQDSHLEVHCQPTRVRGPISPSGADCRFVPSVCKRLVVRSKATDLLVAAGVHRNRTRIPRPEEALISFQVKEQAGSHPEDGEIVSGAVPAIEAPVVKRIAVVCSSWYSIRTRVAANLVFSQSSATTSASAGR